MSLDPESCGVWVPAYIVGMAPSGNAAMLLAQVTWLLQPDRSGERRTDIIEQDGYEWIARCDEDWWWIGLDRPAALRARQALTKAGLLITAQGSADGRKTTLIRPDLDAVLVARERAKAEVLSRASARPIARKRATKRAGPRDDAVLIETTTKSEETTSATIHKLGSDNDPGFAAFWKAYPRKVSKGQARRAWAAAVKLVAGRSVARAAEAGVEVNEWAAGRIVLAAERYAADPNLPPAGFIPHPSTWLNGEKWNDGPLPPRSVNGGGRRDQSSEWMEQAHLLRQEGL